MIKDGLEDSKVSLGWAVPWRYCSGPWSIVSWHVS